MAISLLKHLPKGAPNIDVIADEALDLGGQFFGGHEVIIGQQMTSVFVQVLATEGDLVVEIQRVDHHIDNKSDVVLGALLLKVICNQRDQIDNPALPAVDGILDSGNKPSFLLGIDNLPHARECRIRGKRRTIKPRGVMVLIIGSQYLDSLVIATGQISFAAIVFANHLVRHSRSLVDGSGFKGYEDVVNASCASKLSPLFAEGIGFLNLIAVRHSQAPR